jgi:hypothetical protein
LDIPVQTRNEADRHRSAETDVLPSGPFCFYTVCALYGRSVPFSAILDRTSR